MAEEKEIEIEEKDDGAWNQITIPEEAGIDVEVSDEDVKKVAAEAALQPEPIVVEPEVKDDDPELDGIETKGAEKRIRKLIRQRKDRDEEI